MKIKTLPLAAVIMVFIIGGIAAASALGLWKTTNDKVPAIYSAGSFAGQYNPADIRGSYTFDDIFNSFEIPVKDLGMAFGVKDPTQYASFQCKELEAMYSALAAEGKEIGTGSVRYFVALYKGLPYDVDEGTYLLQPALDILKAKADLTREQLAYLESHTVPVPEDATSVTTDAGGSTTDTAIETTNAGIETAGTGASTTNTAIMTDDADEKTDTAGSKTDAADNSAGLSIKGSTTFKELLDWGVSKEDIEKAINSKLPDTGTVIKDYAVSKGVEFSTFKTELQKLADAIKK